MADWLKACFLLCFVGFFGAFRPNEGFKQDFLMGPPHNLTEKQVVETVDLISTASLIPLLAISIVITDFFHYKPVIIGGLLSVIVYYAIYSFSQDIIAIQVAEFFSACGTAFGLVYYCYVYTQVPQDKFQSVTAFTHAALLAGSCAGRLFGQTLISTGLCDYSTIHYVSLASAIVACVIATSLPSVRSPAQPAEKAAGGTTEIPSRRLPCTDWPQIFWDRHVLKWPLWFIVTMTCYVLAWDNIRMLLELRGDLEQETEAIESIQTALCVVAVLIVGYVQPDWSTYGDVAMGTTALFEATMLLLMGLDDSIMMNHVAYIAFQVAYRVMAVIASSELAKSLKGEGCGIVFGIIFFIGIAVEILIKIFATDVGVIISQYVAYGCSFVVVGAIFLVLAAYNQSKRR